MKYIKYFFFLLFVCCATQSDQLKTFLKEEFKVENECLSIIYVAKSGCMACNKKYIDYIVSRKQGEFNIINSNNGSNIDISDLMQIEQYLYLDPQSKLESSFENIKGSSFIGFRNCEIDTMFSITNKDFEAQSKIISNYIMRAL